MAAGRPLVILIALLARCDGKYDIVGETSQRCSNRLLSVGRDMRGSKWDLFAFINQSILRVFGSSLMTTYFSLAGELLRVKFEHDRIPMTHESDRQAVALGRDLRLSCRGHLVGAIC